MSNSKVCAKFGLVSIRRYGVCFICSCTWRNPAMRPLIHNGKKPRK